MRLGKREKRIKMASRKHLQNICMGLLNSFVSRNNDVHGYWGIGKLYSLMLDSFHSTIEINILEKSMSPEDSHFNFMIDIYHSKLIQQLAKSQLEIDFVEKANIILTNTGVKSKLEFGLALIRCKLEIEDELGKIYSFTTEVFCRKHNPKTELKSVRKHY